MNLGLIEIRVILLISTEGATDKVNYLKVLSGKWKPETNKRFIYGIKNKQA